MPSTGWAQPKDTGEHVSGQYAPGTQPAIALPRLTEPVRLDGRIDEPAWEAIEPFPLVMHGPTYHGDITEPTVVRVAYDDNYIYVAGHLYHTNANNMRANSLYRDRWSGDETFAIVLDTFNDNENALWFYTTPLGIRADIATANDGGSINNSWNTFWDVATTRTEEGWFVEMRIPFSSLGFQDEDGNVEMGLIVYRWMAHNNHRYIYPDIPPNWDRAHAKPSVGQDVTLEGVYAQKPIYVTPYALGGVRQVSALNNSGTAFRLDDDPTREIGLDVKYNLTNNLTLDLTANTDFAQVEADDQQINLTRFSLFFPEKRQFFQERASLFEFDTGMNGSRLFHSRRIGLANGEPIRIWGGTRLTGRIGDWDVGLINMQTDQGDAISSENFGVLRLRRRVLNPYSTAGGLLTTRLGDNGSYNVTYGLDGILRLFGEEYLTVKWIQTLEEGQAANLSPLDQGRLMLSWERRSINGLSYEMEVTRSGKAYDPGIGFIRRQDVTFVSPDVNYQTFRDEDSRFRRIWVGNWTNFYVRNEDGTIESAWLHPFYWFELKNGATVLLSTDHAYEDVRNSFALSENTEVPAGSYWFHDVWVQGSPPDSWFFRPSVTFRSGTFYDGWNTRLSVSSTWNLSKHLELGGSYALNVIRFPDRDQRLNTHLPQLRIQAALNTHLSAAAFLQYNSVADAFNINTRLRYHVREGHDLWLVYNEGINTERDTRLGPRLPVTENRALLFKYTYTFAL